MAAQPAAEHNEAGKDPDPADKRVNDGVNGQEHWQVSQPEWALYVDHV
jgi:hypothetical protein